MSGTWCPRHLGCHVLTQTQQSMFPQGSQVASILDRVQVLDRVQCPPQPLEQVASVLTDSQYQHRHQPAYMGYHYSELRRVGSHAQCAILTTCLVKTTIQYMSLCIVNLLCGYTLSATETPPATAMGKSSCYSLPNVHAYEQVTFYLL